MNNLFETNAYHVLCKMFIQLEPQDLHTCRQVEYNFSEKQYCLNIFFVRHMKYNNIASF